MKSSSRERGAHASARLAAVLCIFVASLSLATGSTSEAVAPNASLTIQLSDPTAFIGELAKVGTTHSIVDSAALKALLGWEPHFAPREHNRTWLYATATTTRESGSSISRVDAVYRREGATEAGTLTLDLRSDFYCVRFNNIASAIGQPTRYYKEGADLSGAFKRRTTNIYIAAYDADSVTRLNFWFEYQECVRQISITKNIARIQ